MRLDGIHPGDLVQVDMRGRLFHALVTDTTPDGLALRPIERGINHYSCRARQVVVHWARRGRPRSDGDEAQAAPHAQQAPSELDEAGQLELGACA